MRLSHRWRKNSTAFFQTNASLVSPNLKADRKAEPAKRRAFCTSGASKRHGDIGLSPQKAYDPTVTGRVAFRFSRHEARTAFFLRVYEHPFVFCPALSSIVLPVPVRFASASSQNTPWFPLSVTVEFETSIDE